MDRKTKIGILSSQSNFTLHLKTLTFGMLSVLQE